jgi:hypothetical protein
MSILLSGWCNPVYVQGTVSMTPFGTLKRAPQGQELTPSNESSITECFPHSPNTAGSAVYLAKKNLHAHLGTHRSEQQPMASV